MRTSVQTSHLTVSKQMCILHGSIVLSKAPYAWGGAPRAVGVLCEKQAILGRLSLILPRFLTHYKESLEWVLKREEETL